MYQIFQWNDKSELKKIDTYKYWNDESEEGRKAWDIRDGNFKKLEKHISNIGLKDDLLRALKLSGLRNKKIMLRGIELGGGVCWSAPYLFRQLSISEMEFLEFSEHRIMKIAPLILQHYDIPSDKVKLILGSFYETKCPNESMDFILLSQAFHHATDVERLLKEIYRILRKEGVVIIIGEHYCNAKYVFQCMQERIIDYITGNFNSDKIMLYKQSGCIGLDARLGDRYYSIWSYARMFHKFHFECKRLKLSRKESLGFILWKK